MEMTRMFSLTPGSCGRRQQMPRTIKSIFTPAWEASYSAWMTFSSTSELIFTMMRPGRPARAWSRSRSMKPFDPAAEIERAHEHFLEARDIRRGR